MSNQTIKQIHTSCQGCIWGTYPDQTSKTQSDCGLELLNHYKSNGTEILECYKDDDEFYVVNGRKCYFKRNKDWWNKIYDLKKDHLQEVFNETKIKYMAIITSEDDDLENIKISLNSILNQTLKPTFIVVIRKFGSKIDAKELNKILADTGKKWRMSTPSSQDITPNFIISGLTDIFWNKYPIYLSITAGNVLFENGLMMFCSDKVVYDNFQMGVIPINDGGKIANCYIHKIFRGDFPEQCLTPLTQ